LTNALVPKSLSHTISWLSTYTAKDNQKSFSSNEDNKESNEPDYNEDRNQLKGEQEGETEEITPNQIF
jgi:hypothetical protein